MRKIKLITFLTVVLCFAIFSCTNDRAEMNSNIIKTKDIEFVGIEHNIMLDETYQFLKNESSKKSYKNKSSKSKKESLEAFLISLVKSNRKYSEQSNKVAIESIKNLFIESKNSKESSTYSKNISNKLSDKEKTYLDDLDNILNETDFENDEDFEERISNLESKIENEENLSDEQLITLFSATQTAKYSYIYWKENWVKWLDIKKDLGINIAYREEGCSCLEDDQEDDPDTETSDEDGHNGCLCAAGGGILKADVAGAVGGAAYAWAVNVVPGAGQVAYGGLIVGTAAAGSAIAAFYQLFD